MSNIEIAAQLENIQHLPGHPPPGSVTTAEDDAHLVEAGAAAAVVERAHHGGGWLLSGIISVNILILGCALVSGSVFNSVAVTAVHRQVFLLVLLLLTVGWMLLYTGVTSPRHRQGMFKDSHAGPVWLRGENHDAPFTVETLPGVLITSAVDCCRRPAAVRLPQSPHGHLQDRLLRGLPSLRLWHQSGLPCRAGAVCVHPG